MKKPVKLDGVDAEHLREVLDSPGWQLIKQRLMKTLEGKMRDLVRPQNEVETATLRGAIQSLELAIKVPEILVQESLQK